MSAPSSYQVASISKWNKKNRDVPGSIFYRVPSIKTVFYRVRVPSI